MIKFPTLPNQNIPNNFLRNGFIVFNYLNTVIYYGYQLTLHNFMSK